VFSSLLSCCKPFIFAMTPANFNCLPENRISGAFSGLPAF